MPATHAAQRGMPPLPARAEALRQLAPLQQLPDHELLLLARQAVLRAVEPEQMVMVAQRPAHTLWLVLAGTVEHLMEDESGAPITLELLGPGDFFGEDGLFGSRYRRTSARAATRCVLLQWRYTALHPQLDVLSTFVGMLRVRFREQLLHTTLASVPILASLTPAERLSLATSIDDMRLERHHTILQAGEMGHELYILAEGQAVVVHQERAVAVLNPGDIFGEMSLLDRQPHEASVIALTPVHLLRLPAAALRHLIAQRPDVAHELQRLARQRRAIDRRPQHIATTERLIASGIVRGELALVRRPELCDPHCRRCEQACAARFGVARLRIDGPRFGDLIAADLCRQCRWGAECVEVCPVDAFQLDADGVWLITDRCTGCGACLSACPYQAINQVPVYPPVHTPLDWLRQRLGRQEATMLRANKCDACAGYHDHACVSACPTGALQWIPVAALYTHAETSP